MKTSLPNATRTRLPQYLRIVKEFKERGSDHICSYQIGRLLDISDATVRKDLAYLTSLNGKSAYGYDVNNLIDNLEKEIGFNKNEKIILVGIGVIGSTILSYNFTPNRYGKIVAAFDVTNQEANSKINGVPVYRYDELAKKMPRDTKIAILAVSKEQLETTINKLVSLKIEIIINFSTGLPRKRKNVR